MPLLLRVVPPRVMVGAGALVIAASCFLNADLTADTGSLQLILPQALRAIGFPLFAVPTLQLATAGLPPRDTADASSLTNIFRNLGGSMGIALLATVLQSREQVHFAALANHITANADKSVARIEQLTGFFLSRTGDPDTAGAQALAMISAQAHQQATIMAYADAFNALGYLMMFSILAVFLLPKKFDGAFGQAH
jgi:DHA2 family multidrug resistance protein